MIRGATPADVPRLLEMGAAFFAESGFAAESAFDPDSTRATFEHLMASPDGALLVAESGGALVGMLGALAFPFYFNAAHRTGQELFWWVEPARRGSVHAVRLLRAAERWAAGRGCRTFSMISVPALDGSPAADLYRRCGYRPSEHSFLKVL